MRGEEGEKRGELRKQGNLGNVATKEHTLEIMIASIIEIILRIYAAGRITTRFRGHDIQLITRTKGELAKPQVIAFLSI